MRWIAAIAGDRPDQLTPLGFLGVAAAREGKRAEALRRDRALQAMSPRYLYGRHTMWRARVHGVLGGRDGAVELGRGGVAQGYAPGGVSPLCTPLWWR